MPFESYAAYYDLLYADKSYDTEALYVASRLDKYHPHAKQILDMGCGSGAHALRLAQKGYHVMGVDRSEGQLRLAKSKTDKMGPRELKPEFNLADIRSLRLDRKFDAVISLFHVMSYQKENSDLLAVFQSARKHVTTGGVFLFDAWYGPAVLSLKPETRVKRIDTDTKALIRIAEPEIKVNKNRVDVHYELLVYDRSSKEHETIREIHRMRYLFLPEIIFLLECSGFQLLMAEEWLTGSQLNANTWNCCILAKAIPLVEMRNGL